MHNSVSRYGPEFFLIVVGFSSDGKELADAVVALQPDLQGELDKFRRVNPSIPFSRVEVWKWDTHAAATVGGQVTVVTPEMKRANAAVFVFNERVGQVTWDELNLVRARIPSIPVLPFFPAKPPPDHRMMDEGVADHWSDLLRKRRELSKDWTDPESTAITPLPQYADPKDLKRLAFERLTGELVRVASAYAAATKPTSSPKTTTPDFVVGFSSVHAGGLTSLEAAVSPRGGNVLSIAPSRAMRYVSTVVPTLMSYGGAALILDPTGRIYESTADARELIGPVVKLDPWSLVPDKRVGSLNPMDIVGGLGLSVNEGARYLADFLVPYQIYQYRRKDKENSDPFWPNMQRKLLVGLIMIAASESTGNVGVLSRVRNMLNGDDTVYNFAVKLDTVGKKLKETVPEAYDELSSFLQAADTTRSGIIAGSNQHFGAFGSLVAQRSTDSSSFDVAKWIRGDPITIYVIGPPAGVAAFDSIYRLWFGSLLSPILQRPSNQEKPTLIVLDINETFEMWPGVSAALTQKDGCQVWAIVSDLGDIEWAFGALADSVMSAFSTIQAFRPNNFVAAERLARVLGASLAEVVETNDDEVLVSIGGLKAVRLKNVGSV